MKKITILLFVMAAALVSACDLDVRQDPIADGNIVIRLGLDDLATKSAGTDDENAVSVLEVFVFSSDGSTQLYHDSPTPTLVDGTNYYQQIIHLADMASGTSGSDVRNATVFAIANYTGGETLTGKTLAQLKAIAVDADGFRDGNAVKEHPVFVMTAEGTFQQGTGSDAGKAIANLSLKRLAAKLTLTIAYASPLTTTETVNVFGVDFEATKTWTPMTSGENIRVFLQNAAGNAVLGGASVPPSYPETPSRFTYGTTFFNGASTSKPFYSYPVDLTAVAGSNDEPFLKLIQPWEYVTTIDMGGGDVVVVDRNVVELYYKIMLPASVTSLDANTWYQPTVTLKVLGGEASRPTVVTADVIQVCDWKKVGGDGAESSISDVAITDSKFIFLENTDIEVERGQKADISFYSSGPVTMSLNNITYTKYIVGASPTSETERSAITDADTRETVYILQNGTATSDWTSCTPETWVTYTNDETTGFGGTVSLNHTITTNFDDKDADKSFSVTPYVYSLRLTLNADPSVYKDVTITQNPIISVESVVSKGKVWVNNKGNHAWTSVWRSYNASNNTPNSSDANIAATNYVVIKSGTFDRPNTGNSTIASMTTVTPDDLNVGYLFPYSRVFWVGGTTSGTDRHSSPCRFIVKTEPFDNEHSVTDCRVEVTNSSPLGGFVYQALTQHTSKDNYSNVTSGSPITGNNFTSTIVSGSNVQYKSATDDPNFISPEFMLMSPYGQSSGIFLGQAIVRCATYQEDGYPAGRWRLPTEAEIKFMVKLERQGFVPHLFDGYYWSSSGKVYDYVNDVFINHRTTTSPTNPSQRTTPVRCVYDTWYWGKEEVSALNGGNTWGGYRVNK